MATTDPSIDPATGKPKVTLGANTAAPTAPTPPTPATPAQGLGGGAGGANGTAAANPSGVEPEWATNFKPDTNTFNTNRNLGITTPTPLASSTPTDLGTIPTLVKGVGNAYDSTQYAKSRAEGQGVIPAMASDLGAFGSKIANRVGDIGNAISDAGTLAAGAAGNTIQPAWAELTKTHESPRGFGLRETPDRSTVPIGIDPTVYGATADKSIVAPATPTSSTPLAFSPQVQTQLNALASTPSTLGSTATKPVTSPTTLGTTTPAASAAQPTGQYQLTQADRDKYGYSTGGGIRDSSGFDTSTTQGRLRALGGAPSDATISARKLGAQQDQEAKDLATNKTKLGNSNDSGYSIRDLQDRLINASNSGDVRGMIAAKHLLNAASGIVEHKLGADEAKRSHEASAEASLEEHGLVHQEREDDRNLREKELNRRISEEQDKALATGRTASAKATEDAHNSGLNRIVTARTGGETDPNILHNLYSAGGVTPTHGAALSMLDTAQKQESLNLGRKNGFLAYRDALQNAGFSSTNAHKTAAAEFPNEIK